MYSVKSLRRRTRRVVLTVLGVALSIALTVTMLSIGEGLRNSTDALVEDTEVDLFIVPEGSDYIFFTADFPQGLDLTGRIRDDLGPDALSVAPRYTPERELYLLPAEGWDKPPLGARANGIVPDTLGAISGFSVEVGGSYFLEGGDPFREDPAWREGDFPPGAIANFTGEVVVNRALAEELSLEAGDTVTVSATRDLKVNVSCTVRGVYVADFEGADYRAFHMHLSELQYMLRRSHDPVSEILVDLAEGVDAGAVKDALEEDYEYSPLLEVSTDRDIYNKLEGLYETFEGFAALIALITVVVAMLFISTVMIISVRERTREIGALRAIGFSRRSVFRHVLEEGFMISVAGFLVGLGMGVFDVWAVDEFIKRTVTGIPYGIHVTELTAYVVVEVALVGLVIGAVAGLLPAYWATRVDIARTLRQE